LLALCRHLASTGRHYGCPRRHDGSAAAVRACVPLARAMWLLALLLALLVALLLALRLVQQPARWLPILPPQSPSG